MDDNMKAELCAVTVENTAAAYPEFCGAVLHSDRGSQYTSTSYRAMLNEYGVKQSMNSAGGRCHDNACCKSIRGLVTRMKNELFYTRGRRSTDYTTEQQCNGINIHFATLREYLCHCTAAKKFLGKR